MNRVQESRLAENPQGGFSFSFAVRNSYRRFFKKFDSNVRNQPSLSGGRFYDTASGIGRAQCETPAFTVNYSDVTIPQAVLTTRNSAEERLNRSREVVTILQAVLATRNDDEDRDPEPGIRELRYRKRYWPRVILLGSGSEEVAALALRYRKRYWPREIHDAQSSAGRQSKLRYRKRYWLRVMRRRA